MHYKGLEYQNALNYAWTKQHSYQLVQKQAQIEHSEFNQWDIHVQIYQAMHMHATKSLHNNNLKLLTIHVKLLT